MGFTHTQRTPAQWTQANSVTRMLGWIKIAVAPQERVLLFKNKAMIDILMPGEYRYIDLLHQLSTQVYDISNAAFNHSLDSWLIKEKPHWLAKHFTHVTVMAHQVGLRYEDGVLMEILPPASRKLYWKAVVETRVTLLDIAQDYELQEPLLSAIAHAKEMPDKPQLAQHLLLAEITENTVGLLNVNGRIERELQPGLYGFWRFHRALTLESIDRRTQMLDVQGQEILSKDKVSLRLNLSASYRVISANKLVNSVTHATDYLYKALQLSLREAIGTRTLDELLANKGEISDRIFAQAKHQADFVGIELLQVGVKDIILPGEMKHILNQVVEAEKAAQANVIKRREETAATRSLLNTAKLMEDNPVLLRLKELEILERVTEKVDKITVYGGMDSLLQELVKIKP